MDRRGQPLTFYIASGAALFVILSMVGAWGIVPWVIGNVIGFLLHRNGEE